MQFRRLPLWPAGEDSRLGARADDLLVRALSGGPASVDPEWQRRLQIRALDALGELDPEHRKRILQRVMGWNRRSTDKAQQTAVSNLLLRAMAAGLLLSNSWIQLRRLTAAIGAPNFWTVVWAVTWRSAVGLFAVFMLLLIGKPSDTSLDLGWTAATLIDLGVQFVILLSTITLLSFVGRLKIPFRYRLAEMVATGCIVALLCIGGTARLLVAHSRLSLRRGSWRRWISGWSDKGRI